MQQEVINELKNGSEFRLKHKKTSKAATKEVLNLKKLSKENINDSPKKST